MVNCDLDSVQGRWLAGNFGRDMLDEPMKRPFSRERVEHRRRFWQQVSHDPAAVKEDARILHCLLDIAQLIPCRARWSEYGDRVQILP